MKNLILSIAVFLLPFSVIAEEQSKLRIVSYNIHHGRGMDGQVNLKRIAKVIADLKPDLVALQEVDKHCRRSGGQDQAAQLGGILGMKHCFGKAIDFQGGEYGLAVISRFPILESKVYKLPGGGEPRIALEVVVSSGGKKLSYVSLHLERGAGEARDLQVDAVMKLMKTKSHPVILAGDFNAARASSPMKKFEKGGWHVLKKNDGKSVRTFHGEKHLKDSNSPERAEIDFFVLHGFALESFSHGVISELVASDHRPIFAELPF